MEFRRAIRLRGVRFPDKPAIRQERSRTMNVQWVNMAGFGPSAWNHGGQPVHTFAKTSPSEGQTGVASQIGPKKGSALSGRRADAAIKNNKYPTAD